MEGKREAGRFQRIQAAKEQCRTCPVRLACLEWAVRTNQDFGIWGMCTERERKRLRTILRAYGLRTVEELLDSPYADEAIDELPVLSRLA